MKRILASGLITFAMTGVSTVAMAQASTAATDDQSGIETIMVTATKRSENLQNVPVAVTAISSAALTQLGVFSTSDLNHVMPNLQVSEPNGNLMPNFTLRGVGVGTEYNSNAASPVGVYVDEVYQAFRSTHGQQLYDLRQIEVVKGPQGTLFGRNTTGGAINFITRQPSLSGENGYMTVGYGSYNRRSFEGAVELTPVEEKVGIRLAGTFVDSDPWMHNLLPAGINKSSPAITSPYGNLNTGISSGGNQIYAFRGTLRAKPSEDIDITLKGYASKLAGGSPNGITTGVTPGTDAISLATTGLGAFYASPLAPLMPPAYSRSANGLSVSQVQMDSIGKAVTRTEGVVLNIKGTIAPNLRITSITDYDSGRYAQSSFDCDGTPSDVCATGYSSTFRAFNQDLRVDYASDRFKVILGAYYGWDEMNTANTIDDFHFLNDIGVALGIPATYFNPGGAFNGTLLPIDALPTGITATQDFTQTRKSTAFYGEGSYDITPAVTLTAGLRYTMDKFSYTNALTTYYDNTGAARMYAVSDYKVGGVYAPYVIGVSSGTAAPLNQYSASNQLTGRAILSWKITDDVLTYANYSRGYRGGTYNGLAFQSANQVYFVQPEKVNAFEIGLKSRFLDNKLQVNLAAFRYLYKGQQGQLVDQSATSNLISLNGKESGFEAEVEYAATRHLLLTAGLGLLDSKYDSGNCAGLVISGFLPQQGNCLRSASGTTVDVGGNPFPYAAKISANLGFDYTTDIGNGRLRVHGDAAYTGPFHYDAFGSYSNAPTLGTKTFAAGGGGYWLFNSRINYEFKGYSIAGYVKNLTNKVYYPFGINLESFFGSDYRVVGERRTFGVEVSSKF